MLNCRGIVISWANTVVGTGEGVHAENTLHV